MKSSHVLTVHPAGLVAGGFRHHADSEEFRARLRHARGAVLAEFAPKLRAARGWRERLLTHGRRFLALRRAERRLYPSHRACFFVGGGGARDRDGIV